MRRTSYEEVMEATPEEHRKLIVAVYKRWKRSKTLKARAKGDGAAMEEDGEGADGSKMRLKGGYEAALYGDEDSEEEGDEEEEGGGARAAGHEAAGRRGLDGGRNSGAAAGGMSGGAAGGAGAPSTKFGFPATAGPEGRPVIMEEVEESGVGRKRRRQEEEASEVMAVRSAQQKEAREAEAVRQTGLIHSDSVALAEGEQVGQERGGEGKGRQIMGWTLVLSSVISWDSAPPRAQRDRDTHTHTYTHIHTGAEQVALGRERSWDQGAVNKKRRRIQPESKVMGLAEFQPKKAGTGGDLKKVSARGCVVKGGGATGTWGEDWVAGSGRVCGVYLCLWAIVLLSVCDPLSLHLDPFRPSSRP